MQDERYMLACYRDIELTPGSGQDGGPRGQLPLVELSANATPPAITYDDYRQLGGTKSARLAAYPELFRAHTAPELIDDIRTATNDNYVLGNEWFNEEIARILR